MKKYDICVPREYKTKTGEKRTHFWKVGDAWPMKEKDGLSGILYTRVLPSDKIVLFVSKERENTDNKTDEIDDDSIPF